MNLAAIYHRTTDKYAYQLSDTELVINIETGYDVDHIFIHQGDPYLQHLRTAYGRERRTCGFQLHHAGFAQ